MSDLPVDEVQLARERLQRSREHLQQAFAGDGSGDGSSGSSKLMQGLLLKGVQMVAGRGGPLSAVGPLISLATLLMPLLLRRRMKTSATSLIAPLAIAALTYLRKR